MKDRSRDDDRRRLSEMAERRARPSRVAGATERQGTSARSAPFRPPIAAPARGSAPVEKAAAGPTWAPGVYMDQARWVVGRDGGGAFFSPVRVSEVGAVMEPFAARAMHVAAPVGLLKSRRGDGRDEERLRALDPALLDAALSDPERPYPHRERLKAYLDHASLETARAISGPNATRALDALDAEALTVGTKVLFREQPSVETAAHEAAHVLQALAGRRPANEREALELEARHLADSVSRSQALERYVNPPLGRDVSAPHSRFEIVDADPNRAAETARLLERFAGDLGLTPSDVSVHVDEEAARQTRARGTRGLMEDGRVLLDPERYDPNDLDGRELLAHESVHAAQRRLPSTNGALGPESAEREAASMAKQLGRGRLTLEPSTPLPFGYVPAENGPNTRPGILGVVDELKHAATPEGEAEARERSRDQVIRKALSRFPGQWNLSKIDTLTELEAQLQRRGQLQRFQSAISRARGRLNKRLDETRSGFAELVSRLPVESLEKIRKARGVLEVVKQQLRQAGTESGDAWDFAEIASAKLVTELAMSPEVLVDDALGVLRGRVSALRALAPLLSLRKLFILLDPRRPPDERIFELAGHEIGEELRKDMLELAKKGPTAFNQTMEELLRPTFQSRSDECIKAAVDLCTTLWGPFTPAEHHDYAELVRVADAAGFKHVLKREILNAEVERMWELAEPFMKRFRAALARIDEDVEEKSLLVAIESRRDWIRIAQKDPGTEEFGSTRLDQELASTYSEVRALIFRVGQGSNVNPSVVAAQECLDQLQFAMFAYQQGLRRPYWESRVVVPVWRK